MSPSISKADVAMLGRRALQPVKAEGELLAVFAPGKLVNTKNARLHWAAESRYKRGWRDAVALALLEAGWSRSLSRRIAIQAGDRPAYTNVHFLASTAKAMDDDGLAVSIAPIRDALIECGVIHSDAPDSGHIFQYSQRLGRARRGVEIRVRLAPTGSAAVAAP